MNREDNMNQRMSMHENKLSIRQTMIEQNMFRKWKVRELILKVLLMALRSRMQNLYEIKKISKKKFYLPQILFRQSNNNVMKLNNNLWNYLKLSRRVKRK